MKNKYARLGVNTAIFTVGKFLSKIIVIFMLPLYTSYLSEAEYGTADLITNLCNLIIPIACLGISEGIFREAAAKNPNKEKFFTNGVFLLMLGSLGFLLLSPLLLMSGYFGRYFWLIVTYVIAANVHAVFSQYSCAIGRTRLFAGIGVLNTLLTVLLNILFLVGFGWGIDGYIMSVIIADAVSSVVYFAVVRLYKSFKLSLIDKATLSDLLKFSLPLIPSTVFWWITSVSDRYLVQYICGDDVNGLYAVAYKIPTLLTYVVTIFNEAWKLSAVGGAEDKQETVDFYSKVFKYYAAIMFLGGALLAATARISSGILFAESYHGAWVFIPILCVATVYTALDTFLGSAYFTVKRTMMSFITSMIGGVINIGLNLVLIPLDDPYIGGALGASIATFVSYFVVFVIRASSMHKFIPFKLHPLRLTVNTLLISALAIWMTYFAFGAFSGLLGISVVILLTAAVTAYNLPTLLSAAREIISGLRRKKKA